MEDDLGYEAMKAIMVNLLYQLGGEATISLEDTHDKKFEEAEIVIGIDESNKSLNIRMEGVKDEEG